MSTPLLKSMIGSIVIGLIVWLVLPLLLENIGKKSNHKKAISLSCKILGIAIIVGAVIGRLF